MQYLSQKMNEEEDIVSNNSNNKKRRKLKYPYITVIAHNLKGFDGQFILKYIFESNRFPDPTLIMNGTKITEIAFKRRLRFIDSLNYFQCSLSKLPQLCGLEEGKGYFPHFFNTQANQKYMRVLPEKQYYGYDSMTDKKQEVSSTSGTIRNLQIIFLILKKKFMNIADKMSLSCAGLVKSFKWTFGAKITLIRL